MPCLTDFYNPSHDGLEFCELCPVGTELMGGVCMECRSEQVPFVDSQGIPKCIAKVVAPSTGFGSAEIAAIVVTPIGTVREHSSL